MEWIYLVEYKDFCQAFVKTILNLWFPYETINSWLTRSLLASKLNSITRGYIGFQRHIMNTFVYVSTTCLLKHRLHVSTQH